ncbi:MAG: tetratricopeptide repeat protein [Syntrophus sp. (in: bacteria)]
MVFMENFANSSKESSVKSAQVQEIIAAAEQGNTDAQSRLGEMYAKGLGVGKDLQEASKWYINAAEQDPNCQYNIGMFHEHGGFEYRSGEPKYVPNKQEALKWYRLAAAQGHDSARFRVEQSLDPEFPRHLWSWKPGFGEPKQCSEPSVSLFRAN